MSRDFLHVSYFLSSSSSKYPQYSYFFSSHNIFNCSFNVFILEFSQPNRLGFLSMVSHISCPHCATFFLLHTKSLVTFTTEFFFQFSQVFISFSERTQRKQKTSFGTFTHTKFRTIWIFALKNGTKTDQNNQNASVLYWCIFFVCTCLY